METDEYTFTDCDEAIDMQQVFSLLESSKTSEERLDVIKEHLAGNNSKGRFAVNRHNSLNARSTKKGLGKFLGKK